MHRMMYGQNVMTLWTIVAMVVLVPNAIISMYYMYAALFISITNIQVIRHGDSGR